MPTLHDRIALITGAGTGIGAASARLFGSQGAQVALMGRRRQPLEKVARDIREAGGSAELFVADVADTELAAEQLEAVVKQFGGLDILFNNAGAYIGGAADAMGLELWDQSFAVNVRAPFALCQRAYPHLKRSKSGVVLNNLSTLAHRPVAGTCAYSASKAALLSLTQCLALEWATDGIRVLAVSPGVVETPIHGGRDLREMAAAHPLGRVGTAEEIAKSALFLVSDASAWTTGSVLDVDGGIHLA